MANVPVSYKNAAARGLPVFEVMDTYLDAGLVVSAEPAIQKPRRFLLADSLTLAQYSVVGFDANGKIVMAQYNATVANGVKVIGVLAAAATSGASNSTIYGEVFLTGAFNAGSTDAGTDSPLVWHASFDTLAKRTTWPGLPVYNGNPNLMFGRHLIAG